MWVLGNSWEPESEFFDRIYRILKIYMLAAARRRLSARLGVEFI